MINFGFSLERTFATSYIVDRFMNLSDNCTVLDVISAENGAKFTSIVMVKAVETKLAKNNAEYLSVTVGDKSSACICKIFGSSPTYNFFKSAPAGSIILLEGIRKDYNGAMSPEITSVRMMTDREIAEGNLRNMVTLSAVEGVDILKKDLMSITVTISDDNLRATVTSIFNEFGDEFLNKAAGISMHHAYKNGLLEHTVHSARSGMALLKLYPFISYDLAIAGLLLHDIGKVLEYTDDPNVQKTKIGILQGHLALGYRIVRKFAIQNKVRDDMIERLEHIMLSHHSDPEFGAVVRPATPEAVFVALIDNLDAKMGMVEQLLKSTPGKNIFSEFHKGLESKLLVTPLDPIQED